MKIKNLILVSTYNKKLQSKHVGMYDACLLERDVYSDFNAIVLYGLSLLKPCNPNAGPNHTFESLSDR